jgi:xanthine/CO dehydrogenase XdhC/CoxF family maturation factor
MVSQKRSFNVRAEFLNAVQSQSQLGQAYCLATVVKVDGSASARTGSKAVFDRDGRNVFGWVGGGCAERFVGEQAVEALQEKKTRIVLADLDDEIFGLGIACGGKMEVFIEPVYPEETIELSIGSEWRERAEFMARNLGLKVAWAAHQPDTQVAASLEALVLEIARAIAKVRKVSFASLRTEKDLPVEFARAQTRGFTSLKILGKGRIAEALAKWGALFGWPTTVVAPGLETKDYPEKIRCECLRETYEELVFEEGSAVVVASHHASDPDFVIQALRAGASYVGMIGSRKRALEVIEKLGSPARVEEPLFVPAGLSLDARTPEEIALSVVAELLMVSR